MKAAPPLSSSSSSSASGVNLLRRRDLRRSFSLPPLQTARLVPRASASCASSRERERERSDEHRFFNHSFGSSGGGRGAMVVETMYDVLEVEVEATAEEIKAAYRRLARSCHPDVVRAEDRRGGAAAEFMRIHAAYATLSDPEKRAEYDGRIVSSPATRWGRRPSARGTPPSSTSYAPPYPRSPSPTSGYRRRTWETDQCW